MNSRIDIAQERIESALSRIDAALSRISAGGSGEQQDDVLAVENSELRRRNAEIGERLDKAIVRLQSVLDK